MAYLVRHVFKNTPVFWQENSIVRSWEYIFEVIFLQTSAVSRPACEQYVPGGTAVVDALVPIYR